MNENFYSNTEFQLMKEKINKEILRRGTYNWWGPLTTPNVGIDRTPAVTVNHNNEGPLEIDERTFTINYTSEGSICPTKNIIYPDHKENPGGDIPNIYEEHSDTSAKRFDVDELKNYIIGLSKIQDINLFYGTDEKEVTAFRNPKGIEDALINAQNSKRNVPLHLSDNPHYKLDPLTGEQIEFPMEDGKYVMPSAEYDGEEVDKHKGLGPYNFYDDYGATPGDSNFHPINPYVSQNVDRSLYNEGEYRDELIRHTEGGITSFDYGLNPRNPNQGNEYKSTPVSGGILGSCNVACTGLCSLTCDSSCSESCTVTCWNRCGNACTSSCGNECTGCSTLCYTSCQTKCEDVSGYSCLNAGAMTVEIQAQGGLRGEPAVNTISYSTHKCQGCSYSCQFYPNKKTECWDNGCMGKCFTSCMTYCSGTCFGGCVDNTNENTSSFKTGIGRGCSSGCTANCIGSCLGTCEGYCVETCWHSCKASCSDNCEWKCQTTCGNGCATNCISGCKGCTSCSNVCSGENTFRACSDCGHTACSKSCSDSCMGTCINAACKAVCGSESATACDANCRLNCSGTSCTSQCSNGCSSQCVSCVNTCGFQCGACSSLCSTGCEAACNITCSGACEHSCDTTCLNNCSDECGGCSNLCYSCVGMCIGVCSLKCENGCTSCSNQCSWWCDSSCNQQCFGTCAQHCISACSGSCATTATSENKFILEGPERDPTAIGYEPEHPTNRIEEQESFMFRKIDTEHSLEEKGIIIGIDEINQLFVLGVEPELSVYLQTTLHGGAFNLDSVSGEITVRPEMIPGIIDHTCPHHDDNGSIFIIVILKEADADINDIGYLLPFGFTSPKAIYDDEKNIICIIERMEVLVEGEEGWV